MVIGLVSYQRLLKIAEGRGLRDILVTLEPEIMEDKAPRRRSHRPPAPAGGISIRAAARKYNIANTTIQGWVNKGYVRKIHKDDWVTYIDEERVKLLADTYKSNPGRGSWAVRRLIQQERGI